AEPRPRGRTGAPEVTRATRDDLRLTPRGSRRWTRRRSRWTPTRRFRANHHEGGHSVDVFDPNRRVRRPPPDRRGPCCATRSTAAACSPAVTPPSAGGTPPTPPGGA